MSNETEQIVILQPVAMVTPTEERIYAPKRIAQKITISYRNLLTIYADRPRKIKVSFATDGESEWQFVTAYGFGLKCWYIIADSLTPEKSDDIVSVSSGHR